MPDQMTTPPTMLIGRCSFWPEARDLEAWLRAMEALTRAAEKSGTQPWTSPRAVGNAVLRGHLSRRGVPGLFGLAPGKPPIAADVRRLTSPFPDASSQHSDTSSPPILLGIGLLELNAECSAWQLSAEAQNLLTTWQTADHRQAMEQLALFLLRCSAWLKLAVLKLQSGAWQLCNWDKLKASNGQLRVGKNLLLANEADPATWLAGIEEPVLGTWWAQLSRESLITVQVHAPKTAKPDDGLSLSPLKSPVYLLDSLGWVDSRGRLRLPSSLAQEPFLSSLDGPRPSATVLLAQLTSTFGDHRGVFPLEPVMLRFAEVLGVFPKPVANNSAFIAWADRLLSESFRVGAIELFSAEPGQPRHGRGLFGDARQKLLRWRVHEGFDEICANVASSFSQPETATSL
jgi:hypothetical protein